MRERLLFKLVSMLARSSSAAQRSRRSDSELQENEDYGLACRLRVIREKLERLKVMYNWRRFLGAGYREVPPLDDAAVARLEQGYGIILPDELRAFLQQVHGGGPGPGYGLRIHTPLVPQLRAARPFPCDNAAAYGILVRRRQERYALLPLLVEELGDDHDWPHGSGFIPLVHHGCGMFSVLVVTGEQRGRVWFATWAGCQNIRR
jgi:SMI1 / KNR4 family (SUKH-1)